MSPRKKRVGNLKIVEETKPETEVSEKPVRRTFTRAYKARIIREANMAPVGTVAALLRREGLYASHLQKWRLEENRRSAEARKRGPKVNPLSGEVKRLRKDLERLEKRLAQANEIIDLQKKISKILGRTLEESGEDE
jgi:transposase-like protein